jgi:hypothetical protein
LYPDNDKKTLLRACDEVSLNYSNNKKNVTTLGTCEIRLVHLQIEQFERNVRAKNHAETEFKHVNEQAYVWQRRESDHMLFFLKFRISQFRVSHDNVFKLCVSLYESAPSCSVADVIKKAVILAVPTLDVEHKRYRGN